MSVILTLGLCCGVLFSCIARAREGSAKIPAAGKAAAPPFNIDLRVNRFITEFLSCQFLLVRLRGLSARTRLLYLCLLQKTSAAPLHEELHRNTTLERVPGA